MSNTLNYSITRKKIIQYNHDDLETAREDNEASDEIHDDAEIIFYYMCKSGVINVNTKHLIQKK